jgi:hypothetical protein
VLFATITFYSCKDEQAFEPRTSGPEIALRSGEGDLETIDLLDLLGESCLPNSILNVGTNCNDVEFTDTANVTLAAYPGCTFVVVWHYYKCVVGTLTDYTMGDFQILSHNCAGFETAMNNALSTSPATLITFLDAFDLSIYNALIPVIINENVPPNTFECLHGVYFLIHFIHTSCYKYCVIEFDDESVSYVKVACGSDCCERHTRVCRNANGTLNIQQYFAPAYPPSCENPPTFTGNSVLDRCIRQTSCAYKCISD